MNTIKSKESMGISITDLMGTLCEVRIVDVQSVEKDKRPCYIIEVENNKKHYKFGVINKSAIDSFLKNGVKRQGQIFVKVPEKILKEDSMTDKIQWLSFAY